MTDDPSERRFRLRLQANDVLPAGLSWSILEGYVRTTSFDQDGEAFTLSVWGPGEWLSSSYSTLVPVEMQCIFAVWVEQIEPSEAEVVAFLRLQIRNTEQIFEINRVRSAELRLLADPAALPEDRRDRLGWALGLTAALLLLALWRSDALAIWALLVVVGLVVSGVLSAQEVYGAVRWDVVVLLGSLLPLAQLGTTFGLDRWLVEHLSSPIASWPPYLLLLGLYLITALVTEVVSNQAAVTLMLPLGLALSHGVGVSPWAAMGVTTFAASHSFLTPIGYQTNTMVYAIGNYSSLDFLRLGLPLTLVMSLLTPALALRLCG